MLALEVTIRGLSAEFGKTSSVNDDLILDDAAAMINGATRESLALFVGGDIAPFDVDEKGLSLYHSIAIGNNNGTIDATLTMVPKTEVQGFLIANPAIDPKSVFNSHVPALIQAKLSAIYPSAKITVDIVDLLARTPR